MLLSDIPVMESRYTLALDGINNWVELPPESMPLGKTISLSFWAFGGDRLPASTSVFCAGDIFRNRLLNVHLPFENGYVYFDCGNQGTSHDDRYYLANFNRIYKPAHLEEYRGKWSHWTFTKDITTGTMEIYLNGSLWHRGTDLFLSLSKPADVRLGCDVRDDGLFYHGRLAEVQLWEYARTEVEIRRDMYRNLQGNEPGLRAYWPLNEGNGNIVYDKTRGANHGRVYGGADWVLTKLQVVSPTAHLEKVAESGSLPLQELQNQALQLPLKDRWDLIQTLMNSIQQETLLLAQPTNLPPNRSKKELNQVKHKTYTPIDISSFANRRLQEINQDYPMGKSVILGGTPFTIASTGNNIWDANVAANSNSGMISIKIPINLSNTIGVHTLINTLWGTQLEGTFLSLIFTFDDSSTFVRELIGNSDVRDFYQSRWTNSINSTTTTNVFLTQVAGVVGPNSYRLDKQFISLMDYVDKTLISVMLIDRGRWEFQRALFCGLTVQALL